MKTTLLFVCFTLLSAVTFGQAVPFKRELKVVTISGNGYERGYQHGQQLKKEIGEIMGLWKADLEKSMHIPSAKFISDFLAATNFAPAVKKYTPDVYEEVKGIAAGSGQSFDDVFAFQLTDEYWVYEDRLKRDTTHHHCSSIGVSAINGNPAYVSQNLDVDTWMDGYQVILHIKANGSTPEQYVLACAGAVAFNGINEHGIGVCVNTLMQLSASTDGLPVSFMIRKILMQKTQRDALHALQTIKHASGQNYILGTIDSVYDFEASANKVVRMRPALNGIVYHTNHPVANDDVKPWYKDYYQSFLAGKTQNKNSEVRFATLQERASKTENRNDVFIKATLRSKDDPKNVVCRPHVADKSGFSFASIILTLSGQRTMQATAGPPDESEYRTFAFKELKPKSLDKPVASLR